MEKETLQNFVNEKTLNAGKGQVPHFYGEYITLSKNFYDLHGVIHGDIRPDNVIVDSAHQLHLIDFGRSFVPSRDVDFLLKNDLEYSIREYWLDMMIGRANYAMENPHLPTSKYDIYRLIIEITN